MKVLIPFLASSVAAVLQQPTTMDDSRPRTPSPPRAEFENGGFLTPVASFNFHIDCQGLDSEEDCNTALESAKFVGNLIAKDLLFRIPIKDPIGFHNSIEYYKYKTELDKPICNLF